MAERGKSESIGSYGSTVTIFERLNADGEVTSIYKEYRDGDGNAVRKSLGHTDWQKARSHATDLANALEDAKERHAKGEVLLIDISTLYRKHVSADVGARTAVMHEAWWDGLCRFLGPKKKPLEITPEELKEFARQRKTGVIDARGYHVENEKEREEVKDGTVYRHLYLLHSGFNWAATWRRPDGSFLLEKNPMRAQQFQKILDAYREKDANKARPRMTPERFEKLRPEIEALRMRVTWGEGYTYLSTYLPVLLELYRVYGRRSGEFRTLRRRQVVLREEGDNAHGFIRIGRRSVQGAGSNKADEEAELGLTANLNQLLRNHINRMKDALGLEAGALGMPLFPSPTDPSEPVAYNTLHSWYVKAEENAGLEHRAQGGFHEFRRWYATKFKGHQNLEEVAAVAGWKNQDSMRKHGYAQTEEAKKRDVIEESERRT